MSLPRLVADGEGSILERTLIGYFRVKKMITTSEVIVTIFPKVSEHSA